MSCRTAPAIDHTQPSSIAAKPASSPGVLRHLRRFSYSVTSLEAMTVFARRSEHGLSDGVWYALEALPCMVESNDASALCVRFGLSQEDLDALLSECGCLTGLEKAATFKAGIKRLTGETVQVFKEQHFLLEYHARVKYAPHTAHHTHANPISNTVPPHAWTSLADASPSALSRPRAVLSNVRTVRTPMGEAIIVRDATKAVGCCGAAASFTWIVGATLRL